MTFSFSNLLFFVLIPAVIANYYNPDFYYEYSEGVSNWDSSYYSFSSSTKSTSTTTIPITTIHQNPVSQKVSAENAQLPPLVKPVREPHKFSETLERFWRMLFFAKSEKSFIYFMAYFDSRMIYEECYMDKTLSLMDFKRWLFQYVISHDLIDTQQVSYLGNAEEVRVEYTVRMKHNRLGFINNFNMIIWAQYDNRRGFQIRSLNRAINC